MNEMFKREGGSSFTVIENKLQYQLQNLHSKFSLFSGVV